jgi:hypothetical protein
MSIFDKIKFGRKGDDDDDGKVVHAETISIPRELSCDSPAEYVKHVTYLAGQLERIAKLMYFGINQAAPMLLKDGAVALSLAAIGTGLQLMKKTGDKVMSDASIEPIDEREIKKKAARELLDNKDIPEEVRDAMLEILGDRDDEDDWPDELPFIPSSGEVH